MDESIDEDPDLRHSYGLSKIVHVSLGSHRKCSRQITWDLR